MRSAVKNATKKILGLMLYLLYFLNERKISDEKAAYSSYRKIAKNCDRRWKFDIAQKVTKISSNMLN